MTHFNEDTSRKLEADLTEEIIRVKNMVNAKGYDNYSAFNNIVRNYRNELKAFLKVVKEDIRDFENL